MTTLVTDAGLDILNNLFSPIRIIRSHESVDDYIVNLIYEELSPTHPELTYDVVRYVVQRACR